jgi:hypothetical protein
MQECKNALMPHRAFGHGCVLAFILGASVPAVLAQPADAVGVRAQGMGGAFTAVADDATATWWNPAGLATGPYVNAVIELGQLRQPGAEPGAEPGAGPAWRIGSGGFAAAFPALGLSYYRLRLSEIQPSPSAGGGAGGRQDPGTGDVYLRSLALSQFGATFGQSIGDHLVVASTLKLLNGRLAAATRPGAGSSLDEADGLDGPSETRGAFDIGATATFGMARAGVMVRNVTAPVFGRGADALTLQRQVRTGFALTTVGGSSFGGLTVAVDADLTRAATATGDERRVASGFEVWTRARRFGVRGGISASTLGDRRAAASAGASWAIRSRLYLDGQITGGSSSGRRGEGLDLRVTF